MILAFGVFGFSATSESGQALASGEDIEMKYDDINTTYSYNQFLKSFKDSFYNLIESLRKNAINDSRFRIIHDIIEYVLLLFVPPIIRILDVNNWF